MHLTGQAAKEPCFIFLVDLDRQPSSESRRCEASVVDHLRTERRRSQLRAPALQRLLLACLLPLLASSTSRIPSYPDMLDDRCMPCVCGSSILSVSGGVAGNRIEEVRPPGMAAVRAHHCVG